jgi:tRNA (guanine10-N2)-dimethyltransferase
MNKYLFILGRQPRLAVAELLARFEADFPTQPESKLSSWELLHAGEDFAVVRCETPDMAEQLFSSLGGCVKMARIVETLGINATEDDLRKTCVNILLKGAAEGQRLEYGLSAYGTLGGRLDKTAAQEVKSLLADRKIKARFVPAKEEDALSSAQVLKRGLLDSGVEIIAAGTKQECLFAVTTQVQDFESFASRDYGKPERLMDPGILPPKLARIMINLAGRPVGSSLVDPFCGSGVLLSEGALLGYRMTGVDCLSKAVQAARHNLEWLEKQQNPLPPWQVFKDRAEQLVGRFGPFSFDAAVGEGDLGPILKRPVQKKDAKELAKRYQNLYTTVLSELRSLVRPQGRIILALPRWRHPDGNSTGLGLDHSLRLMGYRRVDFFEKVRGRVPAAWHQDSLLYFRPGQKTAREFYCLET